MCREQDPKLHLHFYGTILLFQISLLKSCPFYNFNTVENIFMKLGKKNNNKKQKQKKKKKKKKKHKKQKNKTKQNKNNNNNNNNRTQKEITSQNDQCLVILYWKHTVLLHLQFYGIMPLWNFSYENRVRSIL